MAQPELVVVVLLPAAAPEVAKVVQQVLVEELPESLTALQIFRLYLNCWRRADQ